MTAAMRVSGGMGRPPAEPAIITFVDAAVTVTGCITLREGKSVGKPRPSRSVTRSAIEPTTGKSVGKPHGTQLLFGRIVGKRVPV